MKGDIRKKLTVGWQAPFRMDQNGKRGADAGSRGTASTRGGTDSENPNSEINSGSEFVPEMVSFRLILDRQMNII